MYTFSFRYMVGHWLFFSKSLFPFSHNLFFKINDPGCFLGEHEEFYEIKLLKTMTFDIITSSLLLSRCFRKMVIILTCKLIWSLMHFSRCRPCISNLDVMTRHNLLYASRVFCLRWYTDSCYLTSHCILDIYIRSTKQRVSCYHDCLRVLKI